MRKRTRLVALAGLAVVVAVGAVVLWPRAERVTQANYDRIHKGMTCAEVEALLGPPGDYRTGLGETGFVPPDGNTQHIYWIPDSPDLCDPPPKLWTDDPLLWVGWESDSFGISIAVDDSGSVVDKLAAPRRTTQGPLDDLLWRARRQWRRWFPE
jgi:hypothetical protein